MLREFLSAELLRSHDQNLRHVAISTVEVSPDLRIAKVYWVPSQAALLELQVEVAAEDTNGAATKPAQKKTAESIRKDLAEALKQSKGAMRTAIAHGLTLKFVPELEFRYDDSLERGTRIDELLAKVGL